MGVGVGVGECGWVIRDKIEGESRRAPKCVICETDRQTDTHTHTHTYRGVEHIFIPPVCDLVQFQFDGGDPPTTHTAGVRERGTHISSASIGLVSLGTVLCVCVYIYVCVCQYFVV